MIVHITDPNDLVITLCRLPVPDHLYAVASRYGSNVETNVISEDNAYYMKAVNSHDNYCEDCYAKYAGLSNK